MTMTKEDRADISDAIRHLKSSRNRSEDAIRLLRDVQSRNVLTVQEWDDVTKQVTDDE